MPKLTVIKFRRNQPAGYGYAGTEEVDVQQLGYYNSLGRWIAVDEEIVPNEVWIDRMCFGAYAGNWRSKFANWIPEKQGGRAEAFA